MTVAITTNTLKAGGAEKQRVTLANGLSEAGQQVTLIVLQERGELEALVHESVEILQTKWNRPLRRRWDVAVVGTTNTELGFSTMMTALRRFRSRLAVIHNPISEQAPLLPRPAHFLLRRVRHVAALSEAHRAQALDLWGIEPRHILPNGVSVPLVATENFERGQSAFTYGFLGRIDAHHKGIDLMLEAFAKFSEPDHYLAIAGDGPDLARMKSLCAELGIEKRVSWLGYQSADAFLRQIDVLLLFSRYEAQPLVVLEAAIRGLPMIVSAHVDVRDIPNAIVVQPGDSAEDYGPTFRLPIPPRLPSPQYEAFSDTGMISRYLALLQDLRGKP